MQSQDSLDLGRAARYGAARIAIARAFTAYMPLVASWNGWPRTTSHRASQHARFRAAWRALDS